MHTTNTLPNGHYLLQSNGTTADRMVYDDEENYVIKHFESSEVSVENEMRQQSAMLIDSIHFVHSEQFAGI